MALIHHWMAATDVCQVSICMSGSLPPALFQLEVQCFASGNWHRDKISISMPAMALSDTTGFMHVHGSVNNARRSSRYDYKHARLCLHHVHHAWVDILGLDVILLEDQDIWGK